MKKQILLSLSLTGLIAVPSHSQSLAEHEGTLTITPSFVSAYMFRGYRCGGFSFQPAAEYSKGPLTLDLTANFPISDKIYGVSDPEFDLAASYSWDIVPETFSVKPGFWVYGYPRAKEDSYKVQFEPYLSFDYTISDIVFTLNFYYDFVMQGGGYEFGFNYSIPIKPLELDMELSALIGRYDNSNSVNGLPIKVKNKGDYFQAGVAIPYEFSRKSKLTAGWYYAKGTNNYFQYGNDPTKELNSDAIGRGFFQVSFSQLF